jgi:endonuclease/exonuclease/phosphatase family metal-dependent hydrolase
LLISLKNLLRKTGDLISSKIIITGKTMVRVLYPIVPLLAAGLLLAGCGKPEPEVKPFSVMSYNLHQYAWVDRDGDGEPDDPKPAEECDAVLKLIVRNHPDILAVQEMGSEIAFTEFQQALKEVGAEYPYADLLRRGGEIEINLAVLSRFPIVSAQHWTNEWYSIGPAKVPVSRGFQDVDIQVTPTYRLRLLNAHLKSKVYHQLGQTEMRRNEARLLNKTVRSILEDDPDMNLLVVGDMNDHYASAPLREVMGKRGGELVDLRPTDDGGAAWTCFLESNDSYVRFDYLFASPGLMPELVREQTRAVRDPLIWTASDHRPLIGVFRPVE